MSEFLQQHLSVSQLITDIMAICMVIGAIDYFRGSKWGLGEKFKEAFAAFGPLTINMIGIISLVPIIKDYIVPVIAPLFTAIGIDPGIISGLILANDMGGYQLSEAIAQNPDAVGLGGMLLASMFGGSIVFNIPVALEIIDQNDRDALSKGIACGFVTIPLGCLAGGLIAGFDFIWTIRNLIPVLIISVIIALLLILVPNVITKFFIIFGKIIMAIALLGTVIGIFTAVTGITVIPKLGLASEGFDIVISIIMLLLGAYVFVELITRIFRKPLSKIGKLMGTNAQATAGLITSLANAVPTMGMIKSMDYRGKVLNFAFLVSAGYLLGDHLAFCAAMDKSFIVPLLLGKLTAGITAVLLALLITRKSTDAESH